ncbi:MAG TPA: glycosyltransferase family 39 protein [Pyrinomonadaceae bacterium]|nr:glycosyltransferase family 39 protein [Pyrinomonadaceae bacterium]
MQKNISTWRKDLTILASLAFFRLLIHLLINRNYGFHRDELAMIDDARHLAWGYVAYPPVTPLFGRLSLILFGPSLVGVRFLATLAQCVAMVLAGLIARELGGKRSAQILAAFAAATAPVSLAAASLFQYVSFDYLWWVLIAYMVIRMLNSGDARWWLVIGATIGIGMLTKYTIGFYVMGLVIGVLATDNRRYLASRWLWLGALLSILIFLPNLNWQYQHHFISLDFLESIHERDVAIGRSDHYLLDQIVTCINLFTLPLALAGLHFYALSSAGKKYRVLAFMFVVPLLLFLFAKGRGYYMTPAYPMLLAAGAVWWEGRMLTSRPVRWATWTAVCAGGLAAALIAMPIAPVNSALWKISSKMNEDLKEEIGWPDLVNTVAQVYYAVPAEERARTGILTGNYGEAGALNLYGPSHGLPVAISGVNSYWLRGYGDPPPEKVIALGLSRKMLERHFESCEAVAIVTNSNGVNNEETGHRDVFICSNLRESWPEFWKQVRSFG